MNTPIEQGHPKEGIDGFRRSLGEFATGVTVITASVQGELYGMTSNSFSSVSLSPALVLWSIRRESTSFAAFEACKHFAVNILAQDQIDLSQRFARSGPDKFDGVDCETGIGGVPLLKDVAARFECSFRQAVNGGDHLILIGEVLNYTRYDRQPLLFSKGRYAIAAEHPASRVSPVREVAGQVADAQPLSSLLVRAYGAIAARLEKEREASGLGLTLMQARLLKAAQTHPDSTLEQLLPELLLDFNASQNVLEALVELGLVTVDEQRKVRLTPAGDERILSIVRHSRANEELLFRNVSEGDLKTVYRILTEIVSERE